MTKARTGKQLLGTALLLGGAALSAQAAPQPAQILGFQPKQAAVEITTPKADEQAACKVELVKGTGQGSGWLLQDAQNQPLRKFADYNGDNKIDRWSYFKDGVEVYREIDSDYNGKADQYRWLNTGGSKFGLDTNEDGVIDGWKSITPEEVSQELLQALVAKDFARLQALLITDAEIKALELSAAEAKRVSELRTQAQAQFQTAVGKATSFSPKTTWIHLESFKPVCLPADQTGSRYDLIKFPNATVLCETGGTNEWVQTGEMIQVGTAWRLTGAPTIGLQAPASSQTAGVGIPITDKELQTLLEQLRDLDTQAPRGTETGPNATMLKFQLQRADLLEKVVAKVEAKERDPWIRQIADCLSTAIQASPAGDTVASGRMKRLVQQVSTAMPGSNLAAYAAYREMTAEYTLALTAKDANFSKVQEEWLTKLSGFVQTYGRSDDTPDALMQLGMVSEFLGKEVEAKKWYQLLVGNFAEHRLAQKASGSIRRMELEGKAFQLSAPLLTDAATSYDIEQARGKVVVVYYWASWNNQTTSDFSKLKYLQATYAAKGFEIVTVNLDNTVEEATTFLKTNPLPATHLHQTGGLESVVATRYGIQGLPSVFLVGSDGKCISKAAQIATLEDDLKKAMK